MADKKDNNEIEQDHNFCFYIRPSNFTKIVSNKKSVFGLWGLAGYIGQFLLIVTVLNAYSDKDRNLPCGDHDIEPEHVTDVYDTALVLLGAFHLIEWFRFILFLVVVFLGANMMPIYYIMYL